MDNYQIFPSIPWSYCSSADVNPSTTQPPPPPPPPRPPPPIVISLEDELFEVAENDGSVIICAIVVAGRVTKRFNVELDVGREGDTALGEG